MLNPMPAPRPPDATIAVGSPLAHPAAQVALLAALYFVVAKLSLLAAIPPGYATSVWPPSGLALAALLLLGPKVWPGVWLGAALANLTVQSSIPAALMIGTGNALEALAGAALIRRHMGVPTRFASGEDVFKFVALSAVAAALAATIGTLAIAAVGATVPSALPAIGWTWWQGDISGTILVAPLILAWSRERPASWPARRIAGLAALVAGIVAAGYLAFGTSLVTPTLSPLMLALTLPLVLWAAFRFDLPEVTVAIAALAAIAVAGTIGGRGPLAGESVDASLWRLLIFVSVVGVSGLAVSAVVAERRAAMAALRLRYDELAQIVTARTHEAQRSEESFRLLVDSIQDYAIFMLDRDGNVASWNRGAQKIKGYRADEIIGKSVSTFYPKEAIDRQWPQQELALARAQGRFEDEGWRLRKDGTRFWANVIITALYDASGRFQGFGKVTRDMTERKRIEALEGSERRVNEFLAMLAHELRNPLAPIRNALDLMRLKAGNAGSDEWARTIIDRQVTQLTRLVDDLLDVGRITSGKIVLKKERVDLSAAVLRAAESCQPAARARQQTIDVATAPAPLAVDGDPIRLNQIVLNLLNNAVKYTPDGGRIDVSVARDGDWAMLRVRDNGIGMPPELLANAFDLFVQGERSLARTEGGLGIGLTVVRQLAALHGGSVVARSEGPGQGSEFIVLLPALPAAQAPSGPAVVSRASAPAAAARRVIVVDDNRDSADMLAALLAAFGHQARAVYDGHAALAAADEDPPDAMLLDIGLPGMSGYDVAQRIRASPRLRDVTLIAFTGYGQDEDRRRARTAGFDHHLVKPVDPDELEALIASVPSREASS